MKIFSALMFLVSLNSYAAVPLADCWTVDGSAIGKNAAGNLIADGQWIVTVNMKTISKDNLVWLLDAAQTLSLEPVRYPFVHQEYIMLVLQGKDDWSHYPKPSPRAEIQQKVNAQMGKIASLADTTGVACNAIISPGESNFVRP